MSRPFSEAEPINRMLRKLSKTRKREEKEIVIRDI